MGFGNVIHWCFLSNWKSVFRKNYQLLKKTKHTGKLTKFMGLFFPESHNTSEQGENSSNLFTAFFSVRRLFKSELLSFFRKEKK